MKYRSRRRESIRGSRATGRKLVTMDERFEEQVALRREAGQNSTLPYSRKIPVGSLG